MLLVCGGASQAKNPPEVDGFVCYSPVLAVVAEENAANLPAIMANVVDPFVVRLSDKDVAKLLDVVRAQELALRREGKDKL